ncbi:hypothetical protein ACGFZ3_00930 [Stenotrophomonas sp. NPDC047960]|uniref:hypothetical protein n=1 Tax=Stenotrophomonas sp. NPDC047960 TaxID=3364531 RepID=UPI003723C42D
MGPASYAALIHAFMVELGSERSHRHVEVIADSNVRQQGAAILAAFALLGSLFYHFSSDYHGQGS